MSSSGPAIPSDRAMLLAVPSGRIANRRPLRRRRGDNLGDRAVAAGRDNEIGGPLDRLGDVIFLGREIIDAIAGALQQLDEPGAAVAPIAGLLVMDQRRAAVLCGHVAVNTATRDATPNPAMRPSVAGTISTSLSAGRDAGTGCGHAAAPPAARRGYRICRARDSR